MDAGVDTKQLKHLYLHPSSFKLMEEEFGLKLGLSEAEEGDKGDVEKENVGERECVCEESNEDEEGDFSFCFSTGGDGGSISADDAFQNGKIRPAIPLFNRELVFASSSLDPPLKKVFFQEDAFSAPSTCGTDPEGPYCEWRKDVNHATNSTSPGLSRKSNSTGFSRLWRLKDFVHLRSNSDGKDAFIFLNNNNDNKNDDNVRDLGSQLIKHDGKLKVIKKKKSKSEPMSLAAHFEKNYGAVKAGEVKRRSSYLPYKVGFFTNVNGLTRNMHPF